MVNDDSILKEISALAWHISQASRASDKIRDFDAEAEMSQATRGIHRCTRQLSGAFRQSQPDLIAILMFRSHESKATELVNILSPVVRGEVSAAELKPYQRPIIRSSFRRHEKRNHSMNATQQISLPFRSFDLDEVVVAFVGDFEYGDRDDLEYFAESCGAEIADSISNAELVVYGENSSAEIEKARGAGVDCLSEAEFLNVVDYQPKTFSEFVDQLTELRYDITTNSNEGDGYRETIDWQVPAGLGDVRELLTAYARISPSVKKEMADVQQASYYPHQLKSRRDDLFQLTDGDDSQGWCEFESADTFAWRLKACNDETTISGISLMRILKQQVDDIEILAVCDKPIDEPITTMYVCGGLDSRGHLVGFVLNHTQT